MPESHDMTMLVRALYRFARRLESRAEWMTDYSNETADATRAEQSAYSNVARELRTVLDEVGFEEELNDRT